MILSLVQTCQDRQKELERFIDSLNAQINVSFEDLQLIFIDQGNNKELFDKLNHHISFIYIESERCSLSVARNKALPFVKGEFIAFPDDDCWYEPDTLCSIFNHLNMGYRGVVAKGTNENGHLTNNAPLKGQYILDAFHHYGAISYTIFIEFNKNIYFDENIGVGSPYGLASGEETDYLVRVMNNGIVGKVIYDSSIVVHHPLNNLGNFSDNIQKAYGYARGNGYLMRKHKYPLGVVLKRLFRPLVGMCVFALTGNFKRSKKSLYIFRGNIEGLLFSISK